MPATLNKTNLHIILWLIAYAIDSNSWMDLHEITYRQLICSHLMPKRHSTGVNIYLRHINKGLTASSCVTLIICIHDQTIINMDLMWAPLCCQGKLFPGRTELMIACAQYINTEPWMLLWLGPRSCMCAGGIKAMASLSAGWVRDFGEALPRNIASYAHEASWGQCRCSPH